MNECFVLSDGCFIYSSTANTPIVKYPIPSGTANIDSLVILKNARANIANSLSGMNATTAYRYYFTRTLN